MRALNLLRPLLGLVALDSGALTAAQGADAPAQEATLVVHAAELASHPIPRALTGKFCEHLGANIYNGMDAQVLRNPTFADYPFATGQTTPDGVVTFQFERERIESELRRQAVRCGWPEEELQELCNGRRDGLACFWSRAGQPQAVEVSPDTGPQGGRAQRIEFKTGGGGIKQWTWLPLHRTRQYEFELLARSPGLTALKLSLKGQGGASAVAEAKLTGLLNGMAEIDRRRGPGRRFAPGRALLPGLVQRVGGATRCRAPVPAPRRPHRRGRPRRGAAAQGSSLAFAAVAGGNFVSAYHWQDGVGPVEGRPTLPNYAWGGVEPNTFGTDEFIGFCRAVGCEPMICVNGGTGTPEEAARWVEDPQRPARLAHGRPPGRQWPPRSL